MDSRLHQWPDALPQHLRPCSPILWIPWALFWGFLSSSFWKVLWCTSRISRLWSGNDICRVLEGHFSQGQLMVESPGRACRLAGGYTPRRSQQQKVAWGYSRHYQWGASEASRDQQCPGEIHKESWGRDPRLLGIKDQMPHLTLSQTSNASRGVVMQRKVHRIWKQVGMVGLWLGHLPLMWPHRNNLISLNPHFFSSKCRWSKIISSIGQNYLQELN